MELINSLKQLKEKLSTIEKTYESQVINNNGNYNHVKSSRLENLEERLSLKIDSICQSQNNEEQITINAGGKKYKTLRSTLLNTQFSNIFQNQLYNDPNCKEIFYDCSRSLFKYVLYIIRSFHIDKHVEICENNKLRLNLEETSNDEALEDIIKEVFYKDADSILKIIQMRPTKVDLVSPQNITNPVNNYDYDNRANRARYDYDY
jgi:hypothetical protein